MRVAVPDAEPPDPGVLPAFADAWRVTRTLAQIAAVQLALLLLPVAAARFAARHPGRVPLFDAWLAQGAAGPTGAALAISITGTLAALLLAGARGHTLRQPLDAGLPPVSRIAGWPQVALILAGMAAAMLALRVAPAAAGAGVAGTVTASAGLAVLALLPAFLLLVCERVVAAEPEERLPEMRPLAALLRVPAVVLLVLAGCAAAQRFGIAAGPWPARVLCLLLLAVAAELALRALGRLFLPPPRPAAARAAIASLLAALLQPGELRPARLAQQMRAQFGIDMARSWAVRYVRAAAPPVLLGLLALAWGLSGVTRLGTAERASYERFGAPVAILRPGLHLLLPWPFGRVRRLEYGAMHAISIGVPAGAAAHDTSTADGPAPAAANRLWDDQPGRDAAYLIASEGGGHESFEMVSADIRVLYRIGLDDASARRALYGLVAPDALVRVIAGRVLARFFADRTLPQVLGARRDRVAAQLRGTLQAALDAHRSGIEVVALVVESLHPPAGAAAAYRSVQAAEIAASTRKAEETGRAQGTLSVAARDAHELRNDARARAAELIGRAQSERWQEDADALAYRDGGQAFLLERYFAALTNALARPGLEIVDHRLGPGNQPIIDLRDPAAAAGTSTQEQAQ